MKIQSSSKGAKLVKLDKPRFKVEKLGITDYEFILVNGQNASGTGVATTAGQSRIANNGTTIIYEAIQKSPVSTTDTFTFTVRQKSTLETKQGTATIQISACCQVTINGITSGVCNIVNGVAVVTGTVANVVSSVAGTFNASPANNFNEIWGTAVLSPNVDRDIALIDRPSGEAGELMVWNEADRTCLDTRAYQLVTCFDVLPLEANVNCNDSVEFDISDAVQEYT